MGSFNKLPKRCGYTIKAGHHRLDERRLESQGVGDSRDGPLPC